MNSFVFDAMRASTARRRLGRLLKECPHEELPVRRWQVEAVLWESEMLRRRIDALEAYIARRGSV